MQQQRQLRASCVLQDTPKPFHLSVSRTVPIRFHQIDPLIASLQAALKQQHSFQLKFCGWRVLMNDEQSRTFLAIAAGLGAAEVSSSEWFYFFAKHPARAAHHLHCQ
ncbi:TPA: hypothetical protein ACH3X1_009339 [Trebouxia sp. C0004]